MSANYEVRGDVAVITLNNPPVNGLGHATRAGLVDGLERARADPAVKAIVLTGAGKAFSGGADIREFGSPKALAEPTLLTVIRAVEASAKPVVAAIHSVAHGRRPRAGARLPLPGRRAGAQIALPEVKLGLLPGAGGTQRLPRVVGVETALNMIVCGEPVSELLGEAAGPAAVRRSSSRATLLDGAVAFAGEGRGRAAAAEGARPEDRAIPNADAFFQFARNTVGAMAKNFPAPRECVDAVAAAVKLKPSRTACASSASSSSRCCTTPEAKALRHAFFAERAASKIPDVPADTPLRPIRKAAVIGAGTMGGGIAMNFAQRRHPGDDARDEAGGARQGPGDIRKNYEAQVKKGKLDAGQARRAHGAAQRHADVRRPQPTPTW